MALKHSVIIPCYNEGENICNLVEALKGAMGTRNVEFILVENGSKDNTKEILIQSCANEVNFKIVLVPQNQGYGYGLIRGMQAATGDYIGWLHADLQVSAQDMMHFIDYAEENGADTKLFLKGNRKNRQLIDRFFTCGMSVLATSILSCRLHDIGAIPVLFHKKLLGQIEPCAPYDFSIETYVYYQAKKAGFRVKRFPINMHQRVRGQSSWNRGFSSKLRQSRVILSDIAKIKKGEPVK